MSKPMARVVFAGLLSTTVAGPAEGRVTGIRTEPATPVVGHSVTVMAIDDHKQEVEEWAWNCVMTDAGTGHPQTIKPVAAGQAGFPLLCGGTYTITLRVRYAGQHASTPETISKKLIVSRPDEFQILKGLNTAVR